jgi:hypothetical protein
MCNKEAKQEKEKKQTRKKKIHSIIQFQIKVTPVLLRKMANERARRKKKLK